MMARPLAYMIAASVLGLGPVLSACATPQPTPSVDVPAPAAAWRSQTPSDGLTVGAGWWADFDDPRLTALVEQALSSNTDLSVAAARVREAEAASAGARAALSPSVDLGVGVQDQRRLTDLGRVTETLAAQPEARVAYEVDLWGRLRDADAAARAGLQASRYGRDAAALFFRDHRSQRPLFRDRGGSLVPDQAYPDAVVDMLKIARHRGWDRIRVSGDAAFRREVWIQAQSLGLEVAGHRPRDRDRQAAGQHQLAPSPSRSDLQDRLARASVVVRRLIADPATQARLIAGALERAGRAERDRSHARDRQR